MRIRHADDLAFVLKNQDVINFRPLSKVDILALPGSDESLDFTDFELSQGQIMARRITNNPRNTLRRPVSIDAGSKYRRRGRFQSHAGMIVIKHEDAAILRIDGAADARVTRAEITIVDVRRSRSVLMLHRLTTPGTILPMGGDNHPFFP